MKKSSGLLVFSFALLSWTMGFSSAEPLNINAHEMTRVRKTDLDPNIYRNKPGKCPNIFGLVVIANLNSFFGEKNAKYLAALITKVINEGISVTVHYFTVTGKNKITKSNDLSDFQEQIANIDTAKSEYTELNVRTLIGNKIKAEISDKDFKDKPVAVIYATGGDLRSFPKTIAKTQPQMLVLSTKSVGDPSNQTLKEQQNIKEALVKITCMKIHSIQLLANKPEEYHEQNKSDEYLQLRKRHVYWANSQEREQQKAASNIGGKGGRRTRSQAQKNKDSASEIIHDEPPIKAKKTLDNSLLVSHNSENENIIPEAVPSEQPVARRTRGGAMRNLSLNNQGNKLKPPAKKKQPVKLRQALVSSENEKKISEEADPSEQHVSSRTRGRAKKNLSSSNKADIHKPPIQAKQMVDNSLQVSLTSENENKISEPVLSDEPVARRTRSRSPKNLSLKNESDIHQPLVEQKKRAIPLKYSDTSENENKISKEPAIENDNNEGIQTPVARRTRSRSPKDLSSTNESDIDKPIVEQQRRAIPLKYSDTSENEKRISEEPVIENDNNGVWNNDNNIEKSVDNYEGIQKPVGKDESESGYESYDGGSHQNPYSQTDYRDIANISTQEGMPAGYEDQNVSMLDRPTDDYGEPPLPRPKDGTGSELGDKNLEENNGGEETIKFRFTEPGKPKTIGVHAGAPIENDKNGLSQYKNPDYYDNPDHSDHPDYYDHPDHPDYSKSRPVPYPFQDLDPEHLPITTGRQKIPLYGQENGVHELTPKEEHQHLSKRNSTDNAEKSHKNNERQIPPLPENIGPESRRTPSQIKSDSSNYEDAPLPADSETKNSELKREPLKKNQKKPKVHETKKGDLVYKGRSPPQLLNASIFSNEANEDESDNRYGEKPAVKKGKKKSNDERESSDGSFDPHFLTSDASDNDNRYAVRPAVEKGKKKSHHEGKGPDGSMDSNLVTNDTSDSDRIYGETPAVEKGKKKSHHEGKGPDGSMDSNLITNDTIDSDSIYGETPAVKEGKKKRNSPVLSQGPRPKPKADREEKSDSDDEGERFDELLDRNGSTFADDKASEDGSDNKDGWNSLKKREEKKGKYPADDEGESSDELSDWSRSRFVDDEANEDGSDNNDSWNSLKKKEKKKGKYPYKISDKPGKKFDRKSVLTDSDSETYRDTHSSNSDSDDVLVLAGQELLNKISSADKKKEKKSYNHHMWVNHDMWGSVSSLSSSGDSGYYAGTDLMSNASNKYSSEGDTTSSLLTKTSGRVKSGIGQAPRTPGGSVGNTQKQLRDKVNNNPQDGRGGPINPPTPMEPPRPVLPNHPVISGGKKGGDDTQEGTNKITGNPEENNPLRGNRDQIKEGPVTVVDKINPGRNATAANQSKGQTAPKGEGAASNINPETTLPGENKVTTIGIAGGVSALIVFCLVGGGFAFYQYGKRNSGRSESVTPQFEPLDADATTTEVAIEHTDSFWLQ